MKFWYGFQRSILFLPVFASIPSTWGVNAGNVDSDGNNEITARELHSYVRENVVQQSGGSQVPELQGDAERVLVRFR